MADVFGRVHAHPLRNILAPRNLNYTTSLAVLIGFQDLIILHWCSDYNTRKRLEEAPMFESNQAVERVTLKPIWRAVPRTV